MSGFCPEYIKVRQAIFKLLEESCPQMEKLPTEFELCKKFGVGRTTVRRALKQLTDEGVIFGRPGIGTFVNPEKFQPAMQVSTDKVLKFGYTDHAGRLASFWRENALKFMSVLNVLTERGFRVDFVTFPGSGADAVKDLKNADIDGLFWSSPLSGQLDMLHRIKDAGIPLVLIEAYPWEDFNVVATDGFKLGYMSAEYLLKQNRRNLLFVTYNPAEPVYKWKLDGFRKALEDQGIKHPEGFAVKLENLEDELDKLFSYGVKIDGIVAQSGAVPAIEKFLKSRSIRIPEDCEIVTISPELGFPAVTEQLEMTGKLAVEKMLELIGGKISAPFKELLEPTLVLRQ
jgi:DNA-binding LacI/PurR family transcriptional regulator